MNEERNKQPLLVTLPMYTELRFQALEKTLKELSPDMYKKYNSLFENAIKDVNDPDLNEMHEKMLKIKAAHAPNSQDGH